MRKTQKGGGYGSGAGPVGYAWGPQPEMWPGVLSANGAKLDGITASNFYPLSPNGIAVGGVDIATPEVGQFGGRKAKKSKKGGKKSRKGGRKSARRSAHKSRKSHGKRRTHRKRQSRRHMRGGFGPQELINFGRDLKYWAKGAVADYMGFQQPVDPSPLSQPIGQQYKVIEPNPTDLSKSYARAGAAVAPL